MAEKAMTQESSSSSSSPATSAPSSSTAKTNGIHNPTGLTYALFAPIYLAIIPLTSYICAVPFVSATSPVSAPIITGIIRTSLSWLVPGAKLVSAEGESWEWSNRVIPAIAVVYIFVAFAATGAISVAGQAAASEKGLDNDHPRRHTPHLTRLPLRLRSAHLNLLEQFPSFALAAALAQTLSPTDPTIVNLLGLHVLVKVAIYYPSYVVGWPGVRSISHLVAVAAVLDAGWRLAKGG